MTNALLLSVASLSRHNLPLATLRPIAQYQRLEYKRAERDRELVNGSSQKALSDKNGPRCLRPQTDHYLLSYDPKFEERRDRQQYFYSRKTADLIIEAILQHFYHDYERIEEEFVCLCAPSIAEIFYREYEISVTLLDIDTRFSFLPKFQYFDLLNPTIPCANSFSFVLFDPPYFGLPFAALSGAVSLISTSNAQLLVGFLKRDERLLFDYFPSLRKTTAPVEYDRWINYGLFSNCDLKGIRRAHEGKNNKKKSEEQKKK